MEKFSVKKPFTILVAVIVIIALGAVSLMHLSMDLLPEMSLPYMIVITTYPGAGPEKVESLVTTPLENALGTISGVEEVSSSSSDNYSMVQLTFEDGTDLDSAMVKLSSTLNQMESSLPDGAGTPSIMQISMDMVATMYVAVEHEGYDAYELTDFVNNDVIPYLSRQDGVASISTMGLVEKTVQVELNQDKIDDLNDRILETTNDSLAEAADQLDEAREQLDEAQEALEQTESQFGSLLSSSIFNQLDGVAASAGNNIKVNVSDLIGRLDGINSQLTDLQTSENTAIAQTQSMVNSLIEALNAAQENGETISPEDAQAYIDSIIGSSSTIPSTTTDYSTLSQNVINASAAYAEAVQNYGADSAEAAAALENYNAQLAILTSAMQADTGISDEDIADISAQIAAAEAQLEEAAAGLDTSSIESLITSSGILTQALTGVNDLLTSLSQNNLIGGLISTLNDARGTLNQVNSLIDNLPATLNSAESMVSGLTQGQLDAAVAYSTATMQLSDAQSQLDSAQKQFDDARDAALESANADALISASTLSQLVYAQNFSMPAGYIDDEDDNSWLLKVGDEFDSSDEIADMLLLDNDVIGSIRLSDVADITVIDNANDSYTKLNGSDGVILSIYKSSASGTNDVSKACNSALEEMEEIYPGMHSVVLVDQGVYIDMIVESIFSSIALGALLAIIILALFLRDVRPTIVVAISIPLSVLFAIVLLYFTGLDLNMMTLSGLSLGIGMLVDNSVVVMENILRLRNKGVPAARAAVQGAKQVKGSIIASTLTTVCVFLPAVFASGTVKTLLYPLALSIGYCLVASLVMALTVVPAACSTLLRNSKPKESKIFAKIQNAYGRSLRWCLKHKAIPLIVAVALLAVSIVSVIRMGIVYIPDMSSNEISASITTPEDMTREDSYAMVDSIIDDILKVDGIQELGIMDTGSTASMISSAAASTGSGSYGSYTVYIVTDDDATPDEITAIGEDVENIINDAGAVAEVSAGGMSEMTSLLGGSGISIQITGNDLDQLHSIAEDIGGILSEQEGLTDVNDASTDTEPALHLVIDRDLAMSYGFTTAQIYAQIAQDLSTTVTSTTVTIDGMDMTVEITDNTDPLTVENLMDMEFDSSTSAMSSASTTSASSMDMSSMADSFSSMMDSSDESADADVDENESTEEEEELTIHHLSDFAELVETDAEASIAHDNLSRYLTVTAATEEGYNTTLISRELSPKLEEYEETLPDGYSIDLGGETTQVNDMVTQMVEMAALALLFIYVIMVAQFQSLLSPFIILFTIPLAFTGGMFGLMIAGEQLSMLSLLGFVILMGTVVNNGIVFVDYANQLRIGGMERHDALVATGITRMRPILMTALTTILAMSQMIFGSGMASQLGRGMSIVIAGGLLYATIMTLYIVPIIYDIFFKRKPLNVDVGSDIDEEMDDAADFLAQMQHN